MHYPTPIHMQKPYRSLGYQGHLPITEKIAKEQLSLPMFAELTNEQVIKVSKVVELFFKKKISIYKKLENYKIYIIELNVKILFI